MVHRIDGPITLYRGTDLALDQEVFDLNARHARATVLQSRWSRDRIDALGFKPVNPTVVTNAVDPTIFHPGGRAPFRPDRKIRLLSMSWSPNARKGGAVYKWLDENLDFDRYDYTFLGTLPVPARNIKVLPAVPSEKVAAALRQSDVYITAGQNECCSNALLEALACGCPAVYLNSGANSELVQGAGLPFTRAEEVPERLAQVVADHAGFQDRIRVETLASVTAKYLRVCRGAMEDA